MQVVKRDGRTEPVQFDKITARIKKLCYELHESVDPTKVAMRVIEGVYDGVTTTELDNLAAEVAATNAVTHPDYASLASRIAVSNLHKATKKSFAETMEDLYTYVDPITGENASLVANDVIEIIRDNAEFLDSQIIYDRDFNYDYFGFKTLERSYLLKINNEIVERPQHMLMRVAVGIHKDDLDSVVETYNGLSEGWFTHATPTLFNSGYTEAPDVQLLPVDNARGQHQRHLRHAQAVCEDFTERRGHWPFHSRHPRYGLLHQRNQWHVQRHCSDVACIQRHRPLR